MSYVRKRIVEIDTKKIKTETNTESATRKRDSLFEFVVTNATPNATPDGRMTAQAVEDRADETKQDKPPAANVKVRKQCRTLNKKPGSGRRSLCDENFQFALNIIANSSKNKSTRQVTNNG
ncbi:MAG: hypothetical protein AAF623_04690 [Planctomycetota bacterium]